MPPTVASTTRSGRRATWSHRTASTPGRCSPRSRPRRPRGSRSARACVRGCRCAGTHFVDVSEPALARLRERGGLATLGDAHRAAVPRSRLRSRVRLRHRRARRGRPAGLPRAEPGREGRGDGGLLRAAPSGALERVRRARRSRATLRARPPPGPPGASTAWRSSGPPCSGWSRGADGCSTSRCGASPSGASRRCVGTTRCFLPLGLLLQRRLEWASGLIDVAGVGELLLVCRRAVTCGVTGERDRRRCGSFVGTVIGVRRSAGHTSSNISHCAGTLAHEPLVDAYRGA